MAQEKMLRFLVEGLTRAFDKQEDCDVMFSVEGQTIGAHRLILNIHSEVLYEMATGWTPDKEPISIDDMTYDSFKVLLRLMYSNEISISNNTVFLFLSASTHLKITHLEELCVDHITKSMTTDNVCFLMNEAVNFKSPVLQEKCCEMFSEQTGVITDKESFVELSHPALSTLLDVESTNILEITLFLNILDWMEQQCENQHLPYVGTNMRHVIGDALYKMRFPTMTAQDFANSATTIKGLLTDTEIAQIFQKIMVFDNKDIECPFPTEFRCKVSNVYTPFSDMKKLLSEDVLFNGISKQYCDCSSVLEFVKDQSDYGEIGHAVLSFRLVSQCCADLANSSAVTQFANCCDQATRNKLYDEFLAWKDIAETENVSDIMNKYMQLRAKINNLYAWSW